MGAHIVGYIDNCPNAGEGRLEVNQLGNKSRARIRGSAKKETKKDLFDVAARYDSKSNGDFAK
jgi:hypothetical protein